MPANDTELMLWALSHGWSVRVISDGHQGSLWKDPARRRFLVHEPGPAADLPGLSDELRARIVEARTAAVLSRIAVAVN